MEKKRSRPKARNSKQAEIARQLGDEREITLSNLGHGNIAIGRLDGRAIFVPYGAPDEKVRVHFTHHAKRYSEARIVEIIEPSPARREVPCPHFGKCGGCHWLHLNYETQLTAKADNVVQTLKRMGHLEAEEILTPVAAPKEFEYRNRVRLHGNWNGKSIQVGFLGARSHGIIQHERCWLYPRALRQLIASFVSALSQRLQSMSAASFELHAIVVTDGGSLALECTNPRLAEVAAKCFKNISQPTSGTDDSRLPLLSWQVWCSSRRNDPPFASSGPSELVLPLRLQGSKSYDIAVSPRSFFQANQLANVNLVNEICSWTAEALRGSPPAKVLDLYGGVGNFAVPLADQGNKLILVEADPVACELARRNAKNHAVEVDVIRGTVERELSTQKEKLEGAALAVLDPPRTGAREAIVPLLKLSIPHILYISCDPPALARDGATLVEAGYRLRRLRVFDLFPNTYHVETLAYFERKKQ